MHPPAMDAADLLNRLRRRKQRLAWSLSATTVVATAAYFVAVTSDAPLLARVVLGRNITLAVVAAAPHRTLGLHRDRQRPARQPHRRAGGRAREARVRQPDPIAAGICLALVLVTLVITWRARARRPAAPVASMPRAAASRRRRTRWRSPATTCRRRRSWARPACSTRSAATACCTPSAPWPAGRSRCCCSATAARARALHVLRRAGLPPAGPAGAPAFAAASTLAVSASYLIAQMVAAGTLVELLFGVPFDAAVVLVGAR
ncbi:MAG: hypothetical protein U1F30_15715 [Steroidobacteraceae bacterium]